MSARATISALWVLACGGQDLSVDQTAYLELIGQHQTALDPGLKACAALESSALSEDCQLHMLQLEVARGGDGLSVICAGLQAERVVSECWFLAAEVARSQGRNQLASQYCNRSGSFLDDCGQHLWQTALHRIGHRQGPPEFSENIEKAEALYSRWLPLLGETTDIESRFWPRFFSNGFEGGGGVVLSWCHDLEPEYRERCEASGAEVYSRELAPRLDDAQVDLCGLREPSSAGIEAWIAAEPHPRLDQVITERIAQVCTE